MAWVDAKAHHMNGLLAPRYRDFDAVDQLHAAHRCRRGCLGEPAGVIVIGQRKRADTATGGARNHHGGRQCAVGNIGMAMQVWIKHGHPPCQ